MKREWGTSHEAIQFVYGGKPDYDKNNLTSTRVYLDPIAKQILQHLASLSTMTMQDLINEAIKHKEKQNEEVTE